MKAALLSCLIGAAIVSACGGMGDSDSRGDEGSVVVASAAEPGVYCPVVEQRVTKQNCDDLTRADNEVRRGSAAFNVPDPMRRGETRQVHLIVDRRAPEIIRVIEAPPDLSPDTNMTDAAPGSNPAEAAPDANGASPADSSEQDGKAAPAGGDPAPTPGQVVDRLPGTAERFSPLVGRHMRAELTGQGFDVVAKSDVSQEVPLGGSATWIWDVKANKGGPQSLTLLTVVEGVVDGRHFVLARTPKVRNVTVEVTLKDRAWDIVSGAPAWIKALTVLLAALGGLITAWFKLPWPGRRERAPEAPGDQAPAGGTE